MRKLDLFLYYKSVIRFFVLQKFFLKGVNTFTLSSIASLSVYFRIKNLDDLLHLCCSNYFYLLKYFLGKRGFLTKINSIFNLGVHYYTFTIQSIVRCYDIFFVLSFITNDILAIINKDYISCKFVPYILYTIKDMSLFSEKKNNIGFFNLKDPLNLRFFCIGVNNKFMRSTFLSFFKF